MQRLEGTLYTSGTGHIRFWRMAETFTGLKLQGNIGKFGALEISDINGYLELPNFKVLAGAESGDLLLWDGGLVEAVVQRPGGVPCHDGAIDVVTEVEGPEPGRPYIMTGGHDGYLRLWDMAALLEMTLGDDEHCLFIEPVQELLVAPGAQIRSLTPSGAPGTFTVQDMSGRLLQVGAMARHALHASPHEPHGAY